MSTMIPAIFCDAFVLAHPSWHPILSAGLNAIHAADPHYLSALAGDDFLPDQGRLFAAFAQPLGAVRYVLVGEGPYPRQESATGVCFMDGAVGPLWIETGLSKQVNRATSLRNFVKMLLVADGRLALEKTTGDALAPVALKARSMDSTTIQTLGQLQENLIANGFLLLNATLVYRSHVVPGKEAKAWQPFLQAVLTGLLTHGVSGLPPPTLVLWGKIAERLNLLSIAACFPKAVSEHPYNLSFIANPVMGALFKPMKLLEKSSASK